MTGKLYQYDFAMETGKCQHVRQRALFNRLKGMNTAAETTDLVRGGAVECGEV